MPITNKPLPPVGEGQTPAIDTCLNCSGSIAPCACQPFCDAPFMGHIHVSNNSHLCTVTATLGDGTPIVGRP